MRKIKSFKLFESNSDFSGDQSKLIENIDSCLVELKDKGFVLNIIIDDNYINVDIQKEGDIDNAVNFYEGYDEFELYEIEDEIIQLEDYIKAKYDVNVEYVPETSFSNDSYYNFNELPVNLDLIRFDIYFKIKTKWKHRSDKNYNLPK
jgi:hypothetical protein